MDIDFQKTSAELVFDLIKRDNPNLPFVLTKDNCTLGRPQTYTATGDFRNTRVSVTPKANVGYQGPFYVTYRRLVPVTLFPASQPILSDWYDPNTGAIPVDTWLGWLNARYGTKLQAADVTATTYGNGNTAGTFSMSFAATCPAFVGTFNVVRSNIKKPLDQQIPELTTTIAQLTAGVAMGSTVNDIADLLTYGADFSKQSATLNAMTTLQTVPQTNEFQRVGAYMAAVSGRSIQWEAAVANKYGMAGARIIRYALPNVNVPEANSDDYNYVAVITPPASGDCWFKGRFLLHYKI